MTPDFFSLPGLYEFFVSPFVEFGFMRRALVACLGLALGCGPVGTFLVLRRMSLMGDALAHAVLPGAALGFIVSGLSLTAMTVGGMLAGLGVALLAGLVTRTLGQREDSSFAAFYLMSLALGVLLVSVRGSNVDLMHVLFGTILAVDDAALMLIASVSSASLLLMAAAYRPLVMECFDPGFLRSVGGPGAAAHFLFLALVVMNLVSGFQALGTLMSVGLMTLPAAAARLWTRQVWSMAATASLVAFLSGYAGLLVSYRLDLPSGPCVILSCGLFYVLSLFLGPEGGLRGQMVRARHYVG